MQHILLSLFCFAFFRSFSLVNAHGFVHSVVVGGQTYPGWNPFVDPYATPPPRVVRKVQSDGFVDGTDPDINCHHEGNDGTAAIANAPAGSQVNFQWAYWPGDHQGPVSTYMANCKGDCSTFSANTARWFKIDADGYDQSTKQWAAAKLIADGSSWTSTIPSALAAGQYLIRFEIVALHSSTPQFYPSCTQINVTGGGPGVPSDDELVTMQDMYRTAAFPNIYGGSISFTIPGPPVVAFGGNSSGTSHPSPSQVSSTSIGAKPSTTLISPPQATAAQCALNMNTRKLIRRRSH